MNKKSLALAALALLSCGPAFAATACGVPQSISWGFETWTFGSKSFRMTMGDGAHDVKLTAMYGYASASPHGDKTDPNYLRQSLVAFTYTGVWSFSGTADRAPDVWSINEVDGNLLSVNIKQKGNEVIHLPINLALPVPVMIPGGRLEAVVDNVTYGSNVVITAPLEESIDVELHVVLWFTEIC